MKTILTVATFFSAFSVQAAPFTYSSLVDLIQKNRISSIESLLPALPADFRSNYTLMYASRSLQESTPLNPRAIMFGVDGSLTCAFNGDENENDFDILECIQFLKTERKFDFRQIQFPTAKNKLTQVVFSASGRSADNTISCSQCHGAEVRPNWDEYQTWPGAYGSNDDTLDTGAETPNYAAFVAQRAKHPRYRHLIQDQEATAPYNTGDIVLARRPNLRFSDLVGHMVAYQDARLLEAKIPQWQSLAFAFSALKCTFTDAQKAAIAQAGLPVQNDTNLDLMYAKTGVSGHDWTTEVFSDVPKYAPYEHQFGYSYLSENIAMAILTEQATAGDQTMVDILKKVASNVVNAHGNDGPLFQIFENILVDIDHYDSQGSNTPLICPEASQLFVNQYVKQKPSF